MQEFGSVEIIGDGRNICLKKAKIWKLTVRDVGELNFSDCEIGEIAVHHTASYRVKDSKIGKFVVVLEKADKPYRGYHIQDLKWERAFQHCIIQRLASLWAACERALDDDPAVLSTSMPRERPSPATAQYEMLANLQLRREEKPVSTLRLRSLAPQRKGRFPLASAPSFPGDRRADCAIDVPDRPKCMASQEIAMPPIVQAHSFPTSKAP